MARDKDSTPCGRAFSVSRRKWVLSCIAAFSLEGLTSSVPASVSRPDTRPAICRGIDYIIRHQERDGAWRSFRYGVLKHNGELTAFITYVLSRYCLDYSGVRQAVSKSISYLRNLDFSSIQLSYPVYTFSFLSVVSTQDQNERLSIKSADSLLNTLEKYRYGPDNGWTENDPHFGGWGYDVFYPSKNPKKQIHYLGPNLSATLFGLIAYRNSGIPVGDSRINQIYEFVCRCQNIRNAAGMPAGDGGFFFSPTDTLRNKAGEIESKPHQQIFPSYGSTTADGLRALRLCGQHENSPRIKAARRWLLRNFSENTHPGLFVDARHITIITTGRLQTYFVNPRIRQRD